jgi:hypothetical protein
MPYHYIGQHMIDIAKTKDTQKLHSSVLIDRIGFGVWGVLAKIFFLKIQAGRKKALNFNNLERFRC